MQFHEIQSASPAQIDTEIARILEEEAKLEHRLARLRQARKPLEEEFDNRGGWTRAFFVNNANGHVHSSRHCSSLLPTTQLSWVTDFSGKDESEIIDAAGWRACTICFPNAPLGYEKAPSQFLSDEEKERKARQEVRQAKAAEKQEQAVIARNGKVLFKTERAAEQEITRELANAYDVTVMEAKDDAHRQHLDEMAEEYARHALEIADALSEKRGEKVSVILAAQIDKAASKVIREAKEWNKSPLSSQAGMGKVKVPARPEVATIIRRYL